MDYREYTFPGLLPGEEGKCGRLEGKAATLFDHMKQIVMFDGRVALAEWTDTGTEWCLVIPGWIITTPWRINTGQLRISVLPLNLKEQLEYEILIRKRSRAENARLVFWNLEE
jgi:hypothetical protein